MTQIFLRQRIKRIRKEEIMKSEKKQMLKMFLPIMLDVLKGIMKYFRSNKRNSRL